jgi:TRAP-type C4-dicarboxylate transport system substrate-binding protein
LLVLLVGAALSIAAHRARGDEEGVLRMATMAPAGTAWARELNAFARDIEEQSHGSARIKWYFGGIAGDEMQMGERLRRGQLDGVASGGPLCEQLAPSMRALRVLGLLTSQAEARFVIGRLWPIFEREFKSRGYAGLAITTIGPHILFSRSKILSMTDLRRSRYWVWDRDDVLRGELTALGVATVPLPLDAAARAYEQGRVDGFFAPASVALAFQWSAYARFVTDLRVDYITACVLVADRALDPLPVAARDAIRAAAAKLAIQFSDIGMRQDRELLGSLFARQGVVTIPVAPAFFSEFSQLARGVRDRLDARLVSPEMLMRVLGILADYRAQ